MPSSREIVAQVTGIANAALPVAVAWHVLVLLALIAVALGWRPSQRVVATLLVGPVLSVSVLGFAHDSPFNAVVFAVLGLFLLSQALRLPPQRVTLGAPSAVALGIIMIAFGFVYPHFLRTHTALSYLVAAPTGVLPCPTLALVIGFWLATGGIGSRSSVIALSVAGVFYGLFGVLKLEVPLDYVLLSGAVALLALGLHRRASTSTGTEPSSAR